MHKIRKIVKDDIKPLIKILKKTKVFKQNEIFVAKELMEIFVNKNQKDYHIYVSELKGRITGYVCFGPTPCTDKRFDLYWIAVDPDLHGQGIGSKLLSYAEEEIKSLGGKMIIIETSSTKRYTNTREFYLSRKYKLGAIIKDFYSQKDDKMVFIKKIKCYEKKV